MRMDIVADTKVPMTVCITVCFLRITLEAAMKGKVMKRSGKNEVYGKRYIKTKKRSVEYVICPLIFQKRFTMVSTQAAEKSARVM